MGKKQKHKKKRTTHLKHAKPSNNYLFILMSVVILFVILTFVGGNKRNSAYVLGVATSSFRNATVNLTRVPGAAAYNIYYKNQNDKQYIHAVNNIPISVTNYTINYLKKNTSYQYYITALDSFGKEFWFSAPKSL